MTPSGDPAVGLGHTRARVLVALEEAGRAMPAVELGELLGIHVNSARFHLDALTGDGLVRREREPRTGPGRPRVLYAATGTSRTDARHYEFLAGMLTELVEEVAPDPAAAAERAGQKWSRARTRGRPSPPEEEALPALVRELDSVGFVSDVVEDPESSPRIAITHCPFLEVAEKHDDVVCSLHLGMMRGALAEWDAPVSVRELEPLVEPGLCLAHLTR